MTTLSLRLRKEHEYSRAAGGRNRKLLLIGPVRNRESIGLALHRLVIGKKHEVMSTVAGDFVQRQVPPAGDFPLQW